MRLLYIFTFTMPSIVVYLEPFYDPKQKTYTKILTLPQMPSMPLSQYVRKINTPVVSTLDNPYSNKSRCIYAILKTLDENDGIYEYNNGYSCPYMQAEDVPRLFAYMVSQHYTIESGWTTILQNSKVSFGDNSRTLLFVASEPSILG